MSTIELTDKINSLSQEDYNIIITLVDKLSSSNASRATLCAIREAEDICRNPQNYKQYTSAEEIMEEVLNEI